jgi:hypothetical protein
MTDKKHHIQYVPEPPGVGIAFVGWSAIGTLLLLAISIGGLVGIYRIAVPRTPAPSEKTFPQPRVDTSEREEMHRRRNSQNKELETWRWGDGQHSTIQIPIERAMQLLAAKGDHAYDPLITEQSALTISPTAAAERATIGNEPTNANKATSGSEK